jgi:hypothetical protein
MSVTKRQLKTVDELQAWIDGDAGDAGAPAEPAPHSYVIVRRAPKSGAADWDAESAALDTDARPRWSPYLRHAISRAKLLFDLR